MPIVETTTTRTGTNVGSAFRVCRRTGIRPACPLWSLTNTAYQVKEKKMKTNTPTFPSNLSLLESLATSISFLVAHHTFKEEKKIWLSPSPEEPPLPPPPLPTATTTPPFCPARSPPTCLTRRIRPTTARARVRDYLPQFWRWRGGGGPAGRNGETSGWVRRVGGGASASGLFGWRMLPVVLTPNLAVLLLSWFFWEEEIFFFPPKIAQNPSATLCQAVLSRSSALNSPCWCGSELVPP